jgi:PAS domain S-box-containing protein
MSGRAVTAVTVLTLALVAGVIAIGATSNHEESIGASLALAIPIGLAFVISGVIARIQRPDNRTGTLLLLVGLTWFLNGISGANNAYLFTLGITLSAVTLGVLAHLLLAFPSGRLDTRRQRVLAVGGYVLAFAANPIILLFSDPRESCARCPRNVMLVHHEQGLARALDIATAVLAVLLVAGIAAVLVQRWRTATAAYRRAVAPVLIAGAAMLVLLAANLTYDAGRTEPGQTPLGWALMVALLGVPLAFLLGLLRSRLARDSVSRLLAESPEASTPQQTEAALRRALGDPTLELGFWLPERSVYVGSAGQPLETPAGDLRVGTLLDDDDGRPLAAVVHDPALLEERELLDGALAAARLAIQKDRLQAEATARMRELERERDFVRAVVNSAPAFFCVLDADGRIIRFNATLEATTGLMDTDEVRGRAFWDVFPAPRDRAAVRRAIERRAADEQEHRWIAKDGGECVVIWRMTTLPEDRFLVSGGDITARKVMEEELRQSRARLVSAADDERRRLERNLHDGAQQRLVSVSLSLRLAQGKLPADHNPELGAALDSASHELARALEELRELARGLHPAVLSDRGLAAALQGVVDRAQIPGAELDVQVDGRLEEQVEVALFYVAAESLTNVAKYAQATSVHFRLHHTDEEAIVEIADNGVGGATFDGGSGLRGLRDRVESLDGTLQITSAPGQGTIVRVVIPCRPRVPA